MIFALAVAVKNIKSVVDERNNDKMRIQSTLSCVCRGNMMYYPAKS
jgi:hypothetical protein